MTPQQEKLFEFIKIKHGGQVRKYTGEPYYNHLVAVANKSSHIEFGFEVGLCHDLLEDTECTYYELLCELLNIGYPQGVSHMIVTNVIYLTDVYTSEKFPNLNRKERKRLESDRLGSVSYLAQSVKYADLIDNTKSIVEHDKGFAKKYISEKRDIIDKMRIGNIDLLIECCHSLVSAENELWLLAHL